MYRVTAGIARARTSLVAFFHLRTILIALLTLLACLSTAHADDIEYAYDDAGRLIQAANRTSGNAVQYTYDAAGNITSQVTSPLTALSIAQFSPRKGPPGTQVIIHGTGFSTTAGSNTVTFNGVAASVGSATQTQLVTTVPNGATTGPISVQVGASVATSASAFTVTASTGVPTITALIPPVGTAGVPVTIIGTDFDPVPANNRVRISGGAAQVVTATPTTIVAYVPGGIGSGKVRVTTPRGLAVSPMDFIVVPTGYGAASILSNGRVATDGSPSTVTLGTASRIGLQLFEGTTGDLLTIGVASTTFPSATIKVFSPQNTQIVSGTVTAAGQGVQIPKLTSTGTYTIVVDPGVSTGAMTINVLKPQEGTLTLGGAPTAITIFPPGRRTALSFSGTQGTFADLSVTGVTLSAGTLSVFKPSGELLISAPFNTSGLNIAPQLPVSGTYKVLIDPTGSIGGSLNVTLQSSAVPVLTRNSTYNLGLTNTTQVALTFRASVGEYLTLAAITSAQPIRGVNIIVRKPDGTQLMSQSMTTSSVSGGWSGTMFLNMGPLAIPGTYTILVQQTTNVSGTLKLTLSAPQTSTVALNATPLTTDITTPGQGVLYDFVATAGQYIAVGVLEPPETIGRISAARVTILKPDGTELSSGNLATTFLACSGQSCLGERWVGSVVVNAGPVRASGSYRVLVQQTGTTAAGTGPLTVAVTNPVSSALTADAPTFTASITRPGQGLLHTFNGSAGEYRAFTVSESQGQISAALISVVAPDGTVIHTKSFAPQASGSGWSGGGSYSGSTVTNIGPLPQSGAYAIVLQQVGSGFGLTADLAVTFTSPLAGSLIANGGAVNVNLAAPGRGLRYTFTGGVGDYLALGVAESSQQINAAAIKILAPDGTSHATGALTTTAVLGVFGQIEGYSGTAVVNAGPLPVAGEYVVLLQQTGENAADTGTLALTLTSPMTGALSPGAAPSNVSIANNGQGVLHTFSGSAGAFYSVALTESNDNINAAKLTALMPDGSVLATTNFTPTAVSGPLGGVTGYTGGAILNLGPLATSGTYRILIQQTGSGRANTGTLALTLSQPVSGSLSSGTPSTASAARPGQGILQTFSGTAGEFHTLQISESYGSYISRAQISVFTSDGTPVRSGTLVPTTCAGCDGYQGSTTLNLDPLPRTGTYSVLVQQATLASSGVGSLTFALAPVSLPGDSTNTYSTSTPGAPVSINFTAVAGQSLNLALTGLVSSPANSSVLLRFYTPNNENFWAPTCAFGSAGCNFPMYRLSQTGTYRVDVLPASNVTLNFTATFTPPVMGTLTPGTPVSSSLSPVGRMGLYTFTATAGQNYAVRVDGVSTAPAGGSVKINVYRGTSTALHDGMTATTATGATLNLRNLPADTYSVLVHQLAPITSSQQLQLYESVNAPLSADGTPSSVSTIAPNQTAYLTFEANAGDSPNLALTGLVSSPANSSVLLRFYAPNNDNFLAPTCVFESAGCNFPMYRLSQTGTYRVEILPGSNVTASFTATLTMPVVGTLTPGTPVNASLSPVGRMGLYTFTATKGQTYALRVDGVSTTPAGGSVKINVYRGTSTALHEALTATTPTGATLNMRNLPADTYSVLVHQTAAATSNQQLRLYEGIDAQLLADGAPSSFSTVTPHQQAYLTFEANAGDSLNLALTGLVSSPANSSVLVRFWGPNNDNFWAPTCSFGSAGCNFPLYRLPQTGTYRVELVPPGNVTMDFTATLTAPVMGSLTPGTPVNLSLSPVGRMGLYTFTATAGQTYALRMDGVSTAPAGGSVKINVYRGGSTALHAGITGTTATGVTLNLQDLPADTYSVLVHQTAPVTSSQQLRLYEGVDAQLPANGTSSSFSTSAPNQYGYLTFEANAGDSVNLALTGLVSSPANNGVPLRFYAPNNDNFSAPTCTFVSAGCNYPMYRLGQTGTYRVEIQPATTVTVGFTATLTASPPIPLTQGTVENVSLSAPGQNGLFTFNATAGQNVALQVSNVTTVPASASIKINVYRGTSTSLYTTATTTTGTTINLSNLPADTYRVLLHPLAPITSSMQLGYN